MSASAPSLPVALWLCTTSTGDTRSAPPVCQADGAGGVAAGPPPVQGRGSTAERARRGSGRESAPAASPSWPRASLLARRSASFRRGTRAPDRQNGCGCCLCSQLALLYFHPSVAKPQQAKQPKLSMIALISRGARATMHTHG